MSDTHFYCDIGSTSTKVLYKGRLIWHEPTCVALHTQTGAVISLGTAAYGLVGKASNNVTVSFPIEHGFVSDSELFSVFMGALLTSLRPNIPLLDHLFGLRGKYATLTCLTRAEEQILAKLLPQVGLRRMKLVPQTNALLAELELWQKPSAHGCIVSMGGQVTEVSLVVAGKVSKTVRLPLGGVQLTELIQQKIAEQTECAISWNTAEKIKCEIASIVEEKKNEKLSVWGKHITSHLGRTLVVSSHDLVGITNSFAQDLIRAVRGVLSDAQPEVATVALEQGVFCVGGGARLKGWEQVLSQELHTHVVVAAEPELTVVKGMPRMTE